MTTGERIRNYREAKGMTQDELANHIGVRKQTIWKYENGTITNIPLDRIEQIAMLLGVKPNDITGWEVKKDSEKDAIINSLVTGVAKLTPENKEKLLDYLTLLLQSQK